MIPRVKDMGKPQCDRNMPPVSGQLKFSQELRDKVAVNTTYLTIPLDCQECEELQGSSASYLCWYRRRNGGGEVQRDGQLEGNMKINCFQVCLLTSYEEAVYKKWSEVAEKKTLEGLSRPLLIRSIMSSITSLIPLHSHHHMFPQITVAFL